MSYKSHHSDPVPSPRQHPGLNHDARTGLGYGLSKNTFHSPRQNGQQFPYAASADDVDIEDLEDIKLDVDILQRIKSKIDTPYKSGDSLIGRSIDHSSLAGGNRPVAIGEVTASGMVPFPGMYKKRVQVGGGVNSPKLIAPGQYNRTGTYHGWSHAPVDDNVNIDYNEYDKDTISLEKARKIARKVLKSNIKSV